MHQRLPDLGVATGPGEEYLDEVLVVLEANARHNLSRARHVLIEKGLLDTEGKPTTDELPADMRVDSKASSATG